MIKEFKEWGADVTSSSKENQQGALWSLLKRNLSPGSWRSAVDSNQIVAAVHVMIGEKENFIYKQIISTAFIAEKEQLNQEIDSSISTGIYIINI